MKLKTLLFHSKYGKTALPHTTDFSWIDHEFDGLWNHGIVFVVWAGSHLCKSSCCKFFDLYGRVEYFSDIGRSDGHRIIDLLHESVTIFTIQVKIVLTR